MHVTYTYNIVITKSVKTYKSKKQLKSNKRIHKPKVTIKKKFKKHSIERTYMQLTEIVSRKIRLTLIAQHSLEEHTQQDFRTLTLM